VIKEKNRFIRGLIFLPDFKTIEVPIDRPARWEWSKAYTFGVISLDLQNIFVHSIMPLRFTSLPRFLTFSPLTLLLSAFPIVWFIKGVLFTTYGLIIGIFLLFFSFLFIILNIVIEYLSIPHKEIENRTFFKIETFYE